MEDTSVYYFYDSPTQVKYFSDKAYRGAIAFRDILIDGETGQIFSIRNILKNTHKIDMPDDLAIMEFDWVSLNDNILYGKAE